MLRYRGNYYLSYNSSSTEVIIFLQNYCTTHLLCDNVLRSPLLEYDLSYDIYYFKAVSGRRYGIRLLYPLFNHCNILIRSKSNYLEICRLSREMNFLFSSFLNNFFF